ncbi:hypothetical protein BsWGS_14432 [Bradybaena similaris]
MYPNLCSSLWGGHAQLFIFIGVLVCTLMHDCCGDCVWYGLCPLETHVGVGKLNCLYRGRPKPFQTEKFRTVFAELCPDLYTGPDVETCCHDSQIELMAESLAIPQEALQRCPSCYHNFMNLWCHLTCSPKQDEFLVASETDTYTWPNGSTSEAITTLEMYISENTTNALHHSCRNVQNPSTNSPVLSLLCGTTAETCTPKSWLDFMGSTDNGHAPFDTFFHVNNTPPVVNGTVMKPLEYKTFACNQAPTDSSQACSCQDCLLACESVSQPSPPTTRCRLGLIDCYDLGFTLAYAAFLLLFGSCVIFSLRSHQPREVQMDKTTMSSNRSASDVEIRNGQGGVVDRARRRCENMGFQLDTSLEKMFISWGYLCAKHHYLVVLVTLAMAGALCAGLSMFQVTIDPVKLWSAQGSRARTEKDYFESHFVPFYRIQQLIISRPENHTVIKYRSHNYTNLFDKSFLHTLLDLQTAITEIRAVHADKNITLQDICFAPLSPSNNNCTIQSVLNYYQNSHQMIDKQAMDEFGWLVQANYLDHFDSCVLSPFLMNDTTALHTSCLGTYGGPVFPWVALGGFTGKDYRTSKAFVITLLVNNHLEQSLNEPAKAWESKLVEFMTDYVKAHPNITIAFSSERSIEDEIDRESKSDIITIVASYLIMFGYVTVSLGRYSSVSSILVEAKISVGLAGVLIVLLSVGASLGFYGYVGVPSTLIIFEVVPFLVLAVGVDNIFILVQKYQREMLNDDEAVEHKIGRVLGQAGPTMLLTSLSECLAFFLGALTEMPAVRAFSLYAAMAVLFDFLLQISMFVSLLTLDAKRQQANRIDVLCCKKLSVRKDATHRGILYTFISDYYSHFLLHRWVRPLVVLVFAGWLCVCGALTSRIPIGLHQSLAMPKDSYVLGYLKNVSEYLAVGAPVFFVVEDGHDFSTVDGQNDICGVSGCPQDSLVQQVNEAAQAPSVTYIAEPVSSWLDDYFSWLSSATCCRYDTSTGDFCPSTESKRNCAACELSQIDSDSGRPVNDTFNKYLSWFLNDIPGEKCSKGGHAAYGTGVDLYMDAHNKTRIGASYFMTYHTILKTSGDYIEALKYARQISDNITSSLRAAGHKHKVFPYSIFYVFYEQYLDIVVNAVLNITYCLAAIFVITFLLLGFDLHSAVIVVVTILMVLVNIMGVMHLWNIELNALSLVNLIMAIGISVEFCSHIVRAFTVSVLATRSQRAQEALAEIGSCVLSGITLTKIAGIIMLAFSKSQLFQVFYFRMYLATVVFGAAHGLVFLPVLLSYVGPVVNKAKLYRSEDVPSKKDAVTVPVQHPQPVELKETTESSALQSWRL